MDVTPSSSGWRLPILGFEPFARLGYGWAWYGMSQDAEVLNQANELAGTIRE